jgi:1-deoxy-D-xylulose-5-phosphate synthase
MLLDSVTSPADLRGLSFKQLDELSREVRDVVIGAVAKCGGHLGSNLGVVELTIALHRVFDSPRDVILWDTGHLAYPHKILTGRRAGFDKLRQADGLSGYPSRAESEHDWVENSHASTILGYADGFALAQAMLPETTRRRIVAVIGDGSMTGGMAYEGLNNLGHSGRKAIIILNDNGRSYAPTISRLAENVARIRLNPSYVKQRARLERLVRDVPVVGDHLAWGMAGAFAGMREMFEPPVFFESLGVRYTGPFDGHDIEGMERALRHATTYDGPIVVHVLTQKGRGYPPAEEDDEQRLHDSGVFDLATGPAARASGKPSYTQAFSEALIKEAEVRPEVVAITAAMPGSTGLLPFEDRFPERMIDVGIAEQHAVTSAAGMAMAGLRPVVAIYSTFLTRAFDQANLDVGLHGQPVVFALDRAGITGDNGASHHGVLDMVLMTKVPGMTVFAPSSYQELQVMLHDALDITSGPTAIRWPNTAARTVGEDETGHGLAGRKVREGDDIAIVGVGKLLAAAEEAAGELATIGVSATVWDPRVVKPLDDDMLEDLGRFDLVLTAEDGYAEGGIGSQISAALVERAIASGRRAPTLRALGVPVRFIPQAKPDDILSDLGLDGPGLAAEARRMLGR